MRRREVDLMNRASEQNKRDVKSNVELFMVISVRKYARQRPWKMKGSDTKMALRMIVGRM